MQVEKLAENEPDITVHVQYINVYCIYIHEPTVEPLYQDTSELRTLSSVSNATFVYLTTSEMRTPHYSRHFDLVQRCPD